MFSNSQKRHSEPGRVPPLLGYQHMHLNPLQDTALASVLGVRHFPVLKLLKNGNVYTFAGNLSHWDAIDDFLTLVESNRTWYDRLPTRLPWLYVRLLMT